MKTIGDVIRMVRTGRKLTQEQVASLCDCSPSYIAMLEKGKRDPNWSFVQTIFREMGVDVAMVLSLVDTPFKIGDNTRPSPMRGFAYTQVWTTIDELNRYEGN